MNRSICKYDSPDYWEWTLQKKDVWNGLFAAPQELNDPIFVNTSVIDPQRNLLDNNWACYPDITALLGFLQYIFLPTVFYYVMHEENHRLATPICSAQELLEQIKESDSPHKLAMLGFFYQLHAVWGRGDDQQAQALLLFCQRFNHYWKNQSCQLYLDVFFSTAAVAEKVKEVIWCEELFEEETGLSYQQFDTLCRRFQGETFAKHLFMRLLNHSVGCLN